MTSFLIGSLIVLAWIVGIFFVLLVIGAIFGVILFSWAVSVAVRGERKMRG